MIFSLRCWSRRCRHCVQVEPGGEEPRWLLSFLETAAGGLEVLAPPKMFNLPTARWVLAAQYRVLDPVAPEGHGARRGSGTPVLHIWLQPARHPPPRAGRWCPSLGRPRCSRLCAAGRALTAVTSPAQSCQSPAGCVKPLRQLHVPAGSPGAFTSNR